MKMCKREISSKAKADVRTADNLLMGSGPYLRMKISKKERNKPICSDI